MRTDIPQTILDALTGKDDQTTMQVRLSGARSRRFVTGVNADYAAPFGQNAGIQARPLPQDARLIGGLLVSAFVFEGEIWMATSFMAPVRVTLDGEPLTGSVFCRPAVAIGANHSEAAVLYGDDNDLRVATIDMISLLAGNAACVVNDHVAYTNDQPIGAIHALAESWLDGVMVIYIDDGGVRCRYLNWTDDSEWPRRFLFPDKIMSEASEDDQYLLNYSVAVKLGDSVFIYITAPGSGDVWAVELTLPGMIWGMTFEAITVNLARFAIGNAIVWNERIVMTGQFEREDPTGGFESSMSYGLLTTSTDGRTFRLDRSTGVAGGEQGQPGSLALRYMAACSDNLVEQYGVEGQAVLLSDANRWAALAAPFDISQEVGDYLIDDAYPVELVYGQQFDVRVPYGDGSILDTVTLGDVVDVDFGVRTANGLEFYRAARCLVVGLREGYADASLVFTISLNTLSAGRLAEMSHPFTMALKGREFLYDPLSDWENFDPAFDEGYVLMPFMVDFAGQDACPDPGQHDALGEATYSTGDIDREWDLTELPEITSLPFDVELYGWSRSGTQTPYTGGTGDQPSNLNAPNDAMKVKFTIQREGEENDIEITVSTPADGSENHFPQTWYKTEAGSYPVILEATEEDGLQVGDHIRKIAMIFSNTRTPDTAETYYLPERIEIPTIMMKVNSFKESFEPVEIKIDFPTAWDFTYDEDTWVWELADDACDPDTSYGWNYAPGFHENNYIEIRYYGDYKPHWAASGAGKYSWYPPTTILTAVGATVTVHAATVFMTAEIAQNGYGYVGLVFDDDTGISIGSLTYNVGTGTIEDEQTFTVPAIHAGKVVKKICIGAAARGYETHFYSVSIDGFVVPEPEPETTGQELLRVGIPVIYFAQKPFYTLNCQVEGKYLLSGEDAYGGVVCLASDGLNYVAARASIDAVELIRVRDGVVFELASSAYDFPGQAGTVHLKYIDGKFEVYIRDAISHIYSGPVISYEWSEADGLLLTDPEISHVGIYALRDAPYVAICGFDKAVSASMAILPGCHRWSEFPSAGTIRVEDSVYTYTGKVSAAQILGPYQGRNVGGPYDYSYDGAAYSGNATEFLRFNWQTNGSHAGDLAGEYLATDTGIVWQINKVDHKPSIKTKGVTVYLKNRGRFFGSEVDGDVIGRSIQVWITHALTGLTQVSGDVGSHGKSSICYLTNDARVIICAFAAAAGIDDLTDRDAIERISMLAGAEAQFRGDFSQASRALSTSPWRVA